MLLLLLLPYKLVNNKDAITSAVKDNHLEGELEDSRLEDSELENSK